MNKLTFLEKCLAKLNLSDDGKIGLAIDSIIKTYEKEIKAYERKISDLKVQEADELINMNETLQELIDEKNEIVSTIEVDKVATNEDRKKYISVYTTKSRSALNKVSQKKKQIEAYQKSVVETIKEYQEQIDFFKELLNEMS